MTSSEPSSPSKHEVQTLREERDRIKKQLYSEYGAQIDAMLAQQNASTLSVSPAEQRERRLQAMLDERTPLRQEVKAAQAAALERLIAEAKIDHDRGVNVRSRLDLLLAMQQQPPSASSSLSAPASPTA
jgi:hypothetical protein